MATPNDKTLSPPSPWEPVTALRRVPVQECGEPLVDFRALNPRLLIERPRFRYRYETLMRKTVAEKLRAAIGSLAPEYRLSIVEGWRAPHIQARMYRATWEWWRARRPEWSDTALRRVVNRFTAPVTDKRAPPPHTTGGAMDIFLTDAAGKALDVCSPYDTEDPRGFPFAAPGLDDDARTHRELLRETLAAVGITNYPGEYWHFSYGDQGWAYRGGHPHALYAATRPTHWTPDLNDLQEAPLERQER